MNTSVFDLYENDVLADNYVSNLSHNNMVKVTKDRKVEAVDVFSVDDIEATLEIEYSPVGISEPKNIEIDL